MKVNPELGNVINIVNKDKEDKYQKKALDARSSDRIADIISVENRQASQSRVESLEDAKKILSDVTKDLENASSRLYTLNFHRISKVIS